MSPLKPPHATGNELQIIEAARWITDGQVVMIGSGITFAVAALAQATHAPDATYLIDSGIVDPELGEAPVSVVDPAIRKAVAMTSMTAVFFEWLQAGRVDVGLLRAGQVDREGGLNSIACRGEDGRVRRLPGAGGGSAIAGLARRVVVVIPHELRRFVDRCEVRTGPPSSASDIRREEIVVVTTHAVLRATRASPELRIARLMAGIDAGEVRARTGFPIGEETGMRLVEDAPADILRALRERVDPRGRYAARMPSRPEEAA